MALFFMALFPTGCATGLFPAEGHVSSHEARNVVSTGLEHIASNYVEPIDLQTLSMAGMTNLAQADRSIRVRRDQGHIVLHVGASPPVFYPIPDENDESAWAEAITDIITQARRRSGPLARMALNDALTLVFDGMTGILDPQSRYISPAQAQINRALRQGFGSVGVYLLKDKDTRIQVIATVPGGPAEQAGIKEGDVITHIDGSLVKAQTADTVVRLLSGPVDSVVRVNIERADSERTNSQGTLSKTITLTRQPMTMDTVFATTRDGIGYIRISNFGHNTSRDLERVLDGWDEALEDGRLLGIILDLRSNFGGLLEQAVAVADAFVSEGTILTTAGRHPDSFQVFEADDEDLSHSVPLVILINSATASAAEVATAALQDLGRAVVVGDNSYGKGTVQNIIDLPNGGELLVTWSLLRPPSGYVIHRLGILPTLCTQNVGWATDRAVPPETFERIHSTLASWRREHDRQKIEILRGLCPGKALMDERAPRLARSLLRQKGTYKRALWASRHTAKPQPRARHSGP